eukprot:1138848-Pelagomonas_calceolata.AAC.10
MPQRVTMRWHSLEPSQQLGRAHKSDEDVEQPRAKTRRQCGQQHHARRSLATGANHCRCLHKETRDRLEHPWLSKQWQANRSQHPCTAHGPWTPNKSILDTFLPGCQCKDAGLGCRIWLQICSLSSSKTCTTFQTVHQSVPVKLHYSFIIWLQIWCALWPIGRNQLGDTWGYQAGIVVTNIRPGHPEGGMCSGCQGMQWERRPPASEHIPFKVQLNGNHSSPVSRQI